MSITLPIARQKAAELIDLERVRQIRVEGWTTEHDDKYEDDALLIVARAYFGHSSGDNIVPVGQVPDNWPWSRRWWKPKGTQRDLERAGALCRAAISRAERLGSDSRDAEALYEKVIDHLARFLIALAAA